MKFYFKYLRKDNINSVKCDFYDIIYITVKELHTIIASTCGITSVVFLMESTECR